MRTRGNSWILWSSKVVSSSVLGHPTNVWLLYLHWSLRGKVINFWTCGQEELCSCCQVQAWSQEVLVRDLNEPVSPKSWAPGYLPSNGTKRRRTLASRRKGHPGPDLELSAYLDVIRRLSSETMSRQPGAAFSPLWIYPLSQECFSHALKLEHQSQTWQNIITCFLLCWGWRGNRETLGLHHTGMAHSCKLPWRRSAASSFS